MERARESAWWWHENYWNFCPFWCVAIITFSLFIYKLFIQKLLQGLKVFSVTGIFPSFQCPHLFNVKCDIILHFGQSRKQYNLQIGGCVPPVGSHI
jgi:hypothetical protein